MAIHDAKHQRDYKDKCEMVPNLGKRGLCCGPGILLLRECAGLRSGQGVICRGRCYCGSVGRAAVERDLGLQEGLGEQGKEVDRDFTVMR